jgi:hypothetical protein
VTALPLVYRPDLFRHSLTRSALTLQHLSSIRTSTNPFGRYHHSRDHCSSARLLFGDIKWVRWMRFRQE